MHPKIFLVAGLTSLLLIAGAYIFHHRTQNAPSTANDVRIVRGDDPNPTTPTPLLDHEPTIPTINGSDASRSDQAVVSNMQDDAASQASLPDPAISPRALRQQIRAEPRDTDWAGRSEGGIKAALAPIPYLGRGDDLHVSCASTLCEVRGIIPGEVSNDNADVAMQALQGDALGKSLDRSGMQVLTEFFSGEGKDRTITIYAKRR